MPTFDTPEPIITVIDIVSGHLWINASDRADTVVEVRPTDPAEDGDVQAAKQTQVEYAAGRLAVTTPKSKIRSLLGRPPSIDVTIDLPTGSRVEAKAMAEIRGSGRIGASMFDSAAGAIRLDETGRLRLRTGAGDVSVARSAGPADVRTSSRKVWIGAGDGTAAGKTANGDITLGEVVRGAVVLETGFGELEIGVADGTAAWLDVRSRHGSVRSELDPADGAEPGAETVEVRARTGFGDIVIRRS